MDFRVRLSTLDNRRATAENTVVDRHAPSPDRTTLGVGAASAAFGFYLCLVGFGALPIPSRINGPLWLAACAGLAFLCAGLSVIVRGLLVMNNQATELPRNAPFWMQAVYWLSAVIAATAIASVGTWVAVGYGDRHISISGPMTGPVGEGVGRTVFGIGAIIAWLLVVALARTGLKKIFGKKS